MIVRNVLRTMSRPLTVYATIQERKGKRCTPMLNNFICQQVIQQQKQLNLQSRSTSHNDFCVVLTVETCRNKTYNINIYWSSSDNRIKHSFRVKTTCAPTIDDTTNENQQVRFPWNFVTTLGARASLKKSRKIRGPNLDLTDAPLKILFRPLKFRERADRFLPKLSSAPVYHSDLRWLGVQIWRGQIGQKTL